MKRGEDFTQLRPEVAEGRSQQRECRDVRVVRTIPEHTSVVHLGVFTDVWHRHSGGLSSCRILETSET